MSEEALHAHIRRASGDLPAWVRVPPGDDMAVLDLPSGSIMIAADQVIEGKHFVAGTPWVQVAHKAVARNLSDVAAMIGHPIACIATVAAPAGFTQTHALFDALHAAGLRMNCPLVGGDYGTSAEAHSPLVISITVLAREGAHTPLRSAAQAGDSLFVTGLIGGSLQANGSGHHLSFTPRLAEAHELSRLFGARLHAMIDLSDGLARDGTRLARASGLQAVIESESLPCRDQCGWSRAISDGEDYELLFSLGEVGGAIPSQVCGTAITRVGFLRAPPTGDDRPLILRVNDGEESIEQLGFEHA